MALQNGNFFKQNWLSGAACTTPNKGNTNRRSRKRGSEKSLKIKPAVCPPSTYYQEFQPPHSQAQTRSARVHTSLRRRGVHTTHAGGAGFGLRQPGLKSWLLCFAFAQSQFPTDPGTLQQGKQDSQQPEAPSSLRPAASVAVATPCPTDAQDLGRCPQRPTTLRSAISGGVPPA